MSNFALTPGTVVGGDFRVIKHLAAGAMGSVYVVEQLSTGKSRAMKVMSIDLSGNERARERFVLEARVGAKIESDHVVEVVTAGFDEATNAPYLVMELLKGEELADYVARRGALPLAEVAEILLQAGHALEQAHAQGIVHRDIKPENLFVAESRREGVPFTVKILDFGIAKLVAERTNDGTQPVGTPIYMAPEQTDRRGLIAPTTDVWPLGLMAFYLLTGRLYWQSADVGITQLLREVVIEPLAPASQRAAEQGVDHLLPPGFDDWFSRCVDRDPRQRFPEAGACVRAFQALAQDRPGDIARAATVVQPPAHALEVAQTVGLEALSTASAKSGASVTSGAGATGMTASATAAPMAAKSRVPLFVGIAAVFALGAGGGLYLSQQGEKPTAPLAAAPPVASPAPSAPASPSCPAGMVMLEGGQMFLGSTDEDLGEDVRPPHKVTISSYCLDQKEVTTKDYLGCVDRGGCLREPVRVDFDGLEAHQAEHYAALCNATKTNHGDHPINCVNWDNARNYCESKGGRLPEGGARLPTEAEWEYAARGSGQRSYPWGDETPGPKRLNACGDECIAWLKASNLAVHGQMYPGDDGFPATAPVGSFADGASSAGILDLAGNVWEWTADWYGAYEETSGATDPRGPESGTERVVRGGGFNGLKPSWAKPAYRWKTRPDTRSHGIGFRCAKSHVVSPP
jgi:eukaryotic-like serine/threonine-protein kinase